MERHGLGRRRLRRDHVHVIGGMGKKGGALELDIQPDDTAEEGAEADSGPSLDDMAGMRAAKQLLSAIDSGDAAAVNKALKAHYDSCSG